MGQVCRHVIYEGHVQGVGFRYKVNELAREFPVHGYVKNLPTGEVELQAQGDEGDVRLFLERIGRAMAPHIERVRIQEGTPVAGQTGFEIRFS